MTVPTYRINYDDSLLWIDLHPFGDTIVPVASSLQSSAWNSPKEVGA